MAWSMSASAKRYLGSCHLTKFGCHSLEVPFRRRFHDQSADLRGSLEGPLIHIQMLVNAAPAVAPLPGSVRRHEAQSRESAPPVS